MTHVEHGGTGLAVELAEQAADVVAGRFIQGADRFVEQQDLGPYRQCPGQRHPLFLSAGKPTRPAVGQMRQAQFLHELLDLLAHLAASGAGAPQAEGDVFAHCQVREQGVVLGQIADLSMSGFGSGDIATGNHDPARIQAVQAAQALQQQGLSGACGAEQHKVFAGTDIQTDPTKGERADGQTKILYADHFCILRPIVRTITNPTVASNTMNSATVRATSSLPTLCSR